MRDGGVMTEVDGGVWYAGHADGAVTVMEGTAETPLPHHVKHSPTGFAWGYGGSGAAELARCLLIHALGPQSRCKACEGTGQVVYVPAADRFMPIAEAEADYTGWDPNDTVNCMDCEDGYAVVGRMYQQFKFDVVARLTDGMSWTIPQAEVLDWHRRYVFDEARENSLRRHPSTGIYEPLQIEKDDTDDER
jgi:hypothetical protein